ncbi:di-heme-cytochrome C peroxidase [Dechloromonas denitrificans]|uniref:di-heme-cytochrome C peroxidase n=1 Tax=Dechloromonas denitrificans TaxID=281362 RepID=UPI001CFB63B9|nr:di-heme-cytochrome C peroxidase [Dechloromonas denitrificans]UCV07026.1 hypothetical protein KI615_16705 [Dechloromonas denitrificans]
MRPISYFVGAIALVAGCSGNIDYRDYAQSQDPLLQGWDPSEVVRWYESSQGSRLIPLAWLQALEQPNSSQPFLTDKFMAEFRYDQRDVVYTGRTLQKLRLPRGFALDESDDSEFSEAQTKLRWKRGQSPNEPWVGMTCAACHTSEITYRGDSLIVQGGPSMADFQSFIVNLNKALAETLSDTAKFERFANRVLRGTPDQSDRDMLKNALGVRVEWVGKLEQLNETSSRYGFGRLDAVGNILNKVALITGAPNPTPNPSNAPVSYPFLWNVPQHDKLQWNGMAGKTKLGFFGSGLDVGALGRNTGEVIGVFAEVQVRRSPGLHGYISSVNVKNLNGLEYMLERLKPPAWPSDVFGQPDKEKVAAGQKLFTSLGCAGCHTVLDRNDLHTPIVAKMIRLKPEMAGEVGIGTDPMMACNALVSKSDTGKMEGAKNLNDPPLGPNEPVRNMLPIVILEVLLNKKADVVGDVVSGFFGAKKLPTPLGPFAVDGIPGRLGECDREPSRVELAYKARPLNGIWATAPYLHNGSVPTLYDLLLPPARRPKIFYVGSKEFDPKHVGFIKGKMEENSFLFDTNLIGNSKEGHDYGVGKLDANDGKDRENLLEYMKTL